MRTRYPRTPHLPWSPGATSDDVRLEDQVFEGHEVVVTEKLDGENTTLTTDGSHARSPDSAHHPSRTRMKALHARIAASIPEDVRICGENLAARHSLAYTDLLGWFYAFSVWQGDEALDWDATVAFARARGLPTPRVLYRGPWDAKRIRALRVDRDRQEGYVVRTVAGFRHEDFARHVAKWVRPHHVQTDVHWMNAPVVWNGLGPQACLWTVLSGGPVDPGALGALVGGDGVPYDPGGLGEARLEAVLAGLLAHAPVAERLPELAGILGLPRALAVVRLVTLAPRLQLQVPDETREGGLVSLARSVDLTVLHGLAAHLAPDDEQVRWSRLLAEEAGLLPRGALQDWVDRLGALLPDGAHRDHCVGEALWARSAGRLRSPEEALAWLHPQLQRQPHVLTVLVGPSGSGKSTLARTLPGARIELDAHRDGFQPKQEAALVHHCAAELRQALAQGPAIWDATGLLPSQRAVPLQVGRELGATTVIHSVLTRRSVAEQRNRSRRKPVPDEVIARQWQRLRWPLAHEAHRLEFTLADV